MTDKSTTYDNPDRYDITTHVWTRCAQHDMRYADHIEAFEKALPAK